MSDAPYVLRWKRWNGDSGERQMPSQPWDWLGMGMAPVPRGPWRTFLYSLGHGLCMGYPLIDVLVFAIRNRHHFSEEWVELRKEQFLEDGYL